MPKVADNKWTCDFGSGAILSIGLNSAHVVIGIMDGEAHATAAFTPSTLHDLATRLLLLAEAYDPRLCAVRSRFIGGGVGPVMFDESAE